MSRRKGQLLEFVDRKPSEREVVARDAADWFVANREGLDATQSAIFAAWLKASPTHIEEYLNIALIGRDLREACNDPEVSLEELIDRAREEDGLTSPEAREPLRSQRRRFRLPEWLLWRPQPWLTAAGAVAAIAVVTLSFLFWKHSAPTPPDASAVAYEFRTRHGEYLTQQLPDNSVVKLDTDTAVWVRFDRTQRVVRLVTGRAEFKVTHDPSRKFVVQAGTVEITDVGTEFDVYARPESTVVTVLEGRVEVEAQPKSASSPGADVLTKSPGSSPYAPIEVAAGQQLRVDNGSWPPTYTPVDTQRATAWLRRQIVFENEPLEAVAAEFNRYATTPIEIDSPALRTLAVSGVFAADDTESFIAFLRSLEGVQVDVSPTRIRVSRK
jgi:transmembrane sensor